MYDDARTFLSAHVYTHVQRWAEDIAARAAVQRGRIVNRISGEPSSELPERHDASDFEQHAQRKRA
jgi:GST-like protein